MEYDPDPEGEFKAGLAYYIHRGAMFHICQDDGLANDDWYYPEFRLKCQYMLTGNFNVSASSDMTDPELRATLKPDFNKAAYKFPKRKIAVKSQRTFFAPFEL